MFSFILHKINVFPCNYFLMADPLNWNIKVENMKIFSSTF